MQEVNDQTPTDRAPEGKGCQLKKQKEENVTSNLKYYVKVHA